MESMIKDDNITVCNHLFLYFSVVVCLLLLRTIHAMNRNERCSVVVGFLSPRSPFSGGYNAGRLLSGARVANKRQG
jgi:hypothetical protein